MKKLAFFLLLTIYFLLFIPYPSFASPKVTNVEPPNWWIGMKWNKVQLLVYGSDLRGVVAKSKKSEIRVVETKDAESPSYVFVTLEISETAKPGNYVITFERRNDKTTISFPLMERENRTGRYQGFDGSDIIYLITPDRFANGDTRNDKMKDMRDQGGRGELLSRHGGDIQGIINHLDYIQELGPTALWINPLVENDMDISYHGYATTNLYRIDPRFGTNELYQKLVREAHRRDIKILLDHVSNHIGINHRWIKDPPMRDWLNGSVEHHLNNHHQKHVLPDPYSDSLTQAMVTDGWFTDYMPDLNQRNPLLATYLIQNTLWWIESTGLDGIREDTYPYADPDFMSDWARAILDEYPSFNIVGEVWVHDADIVAPYQRESILTAPFNTNLPSVTDFGLFHAFMQVFGDRKADISELHSALAKDFLYADPDNLVTFLDNHDVARIMFVCKENIDRAKMALSLLMTLRGIPQIYYGTELGIVGGTDHGEIRAEMPGGFPRDKRSVFLKEERTPKENELFEFTKRLISLRKTHPALQDGRMVHFLPRDNVYAFLRMTENDTILVLTNNSDQEQRLDTRTMHMDTNRWTSLTNLLTDASISWNDQILFPANAVSIFQMK